MRAGRQARVTEWSNVVGMRFRNGRSSSESSVDSDEDRPIGVGGRRSTAVRRQVKSTHGMRVHNARPLRRITTFDHRARVRQRRRLRVVADSWPGKCPPGILGACHCALEDVDLCRIAEVACRS